MTDKDIWVQALMKGISDDDKVKGVALLEIMNRFIEDQNITCAETIYQSDSVIENAYELIEKLCNVAGYTKYDDE